MLPSSWKLSQIYLLLITTVIHPARLERCRDSELGWKGDNVKVLDDCDVLTGNSSLRLDKLVGQIRCITHIRIIFEDSNKRRTVVSQDSHIDKKIFIGELPNKCLLHDVEVLVLSFPFRMYRSRFKLNPMQCYDMKRELNLTINKESKTALIDNKYFHMSNTYVRMCLMSVSLINSNGTEIDTVWRREYEVPVDRCKNETFTLIYTFKSANISQKEKLEKVVDVPWDPKCLMTEGENQMILTSSIAAGLAFAIILVTISIVCYKRREEIVKTDYNDIYGTYAMGWDDEGDYGDGDQMEMTDHNQVYGT